MYSSIISLRNYCYDKSWLPVKQAKVPVISIGNLTVGGSGKTPFTLMIARILKEHHIKVSLLSSGYGRSSIGTVHVVSHGKVLPEITPQNCGDEVYMHALTGLYDTVIAAKPKHKAILEFSSPIIIDDGFQHRAIKRDLDIVLVQGSDLTDKVLPFGTLREPLESLKRADIIVCTDDTPELRFRPYMQSSALFCRTRIKPGNPFRLSDYASSQPILDTAPIIGNVMALAGIAKPERFLQTLESITISPAHCHWFKDHANYSESDIAMICQEAHSHNCSTILTTSKDAVKLYSYHAHFAKEGLHSLALPIFYECIEHCEELTESILTICT